MALIDNLESTIHKLRWRAAGTEWADYYDDTNYTSNSMQKKHHLVSNFLQRITPKTVWDMGANTGFFSRIASDNNAETIAFDIDPAAVQKNYLDVKSQQLTNLLPLIIDLTNPSGGIGWENAERMSLVQRGPADTVLALALVHHLAISNNVPLPKIAAFFQKLSRWLIVEFVPKEDSQVQRLLISREDVFTEYHQKAFEDSLREYFIIHDKQPIPESQRVLYLAERIS